jgi:ATP-dependent helicase/nuclease subunit B
VAIEKISLLAGLSVPDLWDEVARQSQAWLARHGLPARDAVLLLPFAALLAPARAAWARARGWQPRVETPLTLAASLGPAPLPQAGQCSGDPRLDRLSAGNLLRRQAAGAAWAARDAAGFSHITQAVVDAAQALRQAAFERAPATRGAFWDEARLRVAGGAVLGPAATETMLARVALEWAALGMAPHTESCFGLRPSAWMVLRIGGPEPLSEALLGHAGTPSLHLWADADDAAPFAAAATEATATTVERVLCDDFEAEAQASASAVLQALNAGRTPVALVAQDRELVRRVRALLDRAAVPLTDETGWLLATTRAAASVVALLDAALPQAGPDARLDWLKTWPPALADGGRSLDALEALWRGRRHVHDGAAAEQLWSRAQAHLQVFTGQASRTLKAWLDLLHQQLAADNSLMALQADAAGVQVLAALTLSPGGAWLAAAQELRLDLAGFIAWVQETLAQTAFLPEPDADSVVVLTPLARCFGRPFQHVVLPGADHQHLGTSDMAASLLGEAMAAALSMDHLAARRLRQRQALANVLRAPQLTLLRRLRDGDDTLSDSPDVEWLLLERAKAQLPAWPQCVWSPQLQAVPLQPVPRPLPSAAALLPGALSASQLEALRQCPYRFFARALLRLEEPDELQASLAKRDYGTWLHAVLHHFHSHRNTTQADDAQLLHAAEVQTQLLAMDAGELLPYRASFERFAPDYLQWLARREAAGWQWSEGEVEHDVQPAALQGLRLRGRLDRVDQGRQQIQILDYKTGSGNALAKKVRTPLEDTQLAFYAALLGAQANVKAAYLALDDADAPREIEHPDVHLAAAALINGLADEWPRLQAGAAMPALGEGVVCTLCEMRGLCRRDHWAAT